MYSPVGLHAKSYTCMVVHLNEPVNTTESLSEDDMNFTGMSYEVSSALSRIAFLLELGHCHSWLYADLWWVPIR